MSTGSLNAELSEKTSLFGMKLWVVIGICFGVFLVGILCLLSVWVTFRRKSRKTAEKNSPCEIPNVSKEIKVDRVCAPSDNDRPESLFLTIRDKSSERNSEKMVVHLGKSKSSEADMISQCSSLYNNEIGCSSLSGEDGGSGTVRKQSTHGLSMASPLIGLPELSHLGWGHWFTLRDLEFATNNFSAENVVGEGGYGVVYKATLINGTVVAVKKLLNNL